MSDGEATKGFWFVGVYFFLEMGGGSFIRLVYWWWVSLISYCFLFVWGGYRSLYLASLQIYNTKEGPETK